MAGIYKGRVVVTMVGHGCCSVVRASLVHAVHDVVHEGHIGHSSSSRGSRGMVLPHATMRVAVDAAIVEMVWVLITVVR